MKNKITAATIAIAVALMIAAIAWLQGARARGLSADTMTKHSTELPSIAASERLVHPTIGALRVPEEQIGNVRRPPQPEADIAGDHSVFRGSDRARVHAPEPVSAATTKSTTRGSTPPSGAPAATVDDAETPVIMSDYQTWTVIGATASTVDCDRVRFSDGIGIADRSGSWITADQGDVVFSNGAIAGVTLIGNASVRARPEASMADFRKALELLNSGETREISVRVAK
jgi:hypothetical protein